MTIMTVKKNPIFHLLFVCLCFSLSGCGIFFGDEGIFRNRSNDYLKADNIPPLVLDKKLETDALGELYPIPPMRESEFGYEDNPEGYDTPRPEPLSVNIGQESVKIQRLGGQSWILINGTPGEVWPRVRHFLNVNKLTVAQADISSGVIETDWLQFKTDLTSYDRYRLQIDQGVQPDTSEIHILHMNVPANAEKAPHAVWPKMSDNAEREKWLLDELAATLASDTSEGGTSLLAQDIGGATKASLGMVKSEPVMHLRLDKARALGTLSYAVKQEGFTPYESDADAAVFYLHYEKVDVEGPGWFARKWDSLTSLFGDEEEEPVKLESPYTLAELLEQLPRGEALEQAPLSDRDEEKVHPDAPGYLLLLTGPEGNYVVRLRDPYGKRLDPRKARAMLSILRKNLI